MVHTAEWYRVWAEKEEARRRGKVKKMTWGDVWQSQEAAFKKALEDMREECAKAAEPVDESLASVIRQIKIQ